MPNDNGNDHEGHWLKDASQRGAFYARLKSELELTKDEAHALLGIESFYEVDDPPEVVLGTLAVLMEWEHVAHQRAEEEAELFKDAAQLPEAPIIAWTKINIDGYDWSVTFRAGLDRDRMLTGLRSMRAMMELFTGAARRREWQAVVDYRSVPGPTKQPAKAEAKAPPTTPPSGPPPGPPTKAGWEGMEGTGPPSGGTYPVSKPPSGPHDYPSGEGRPPPPTEDQEVTFDLTAVVAQISGSGKRHYACQGGRFRRHGITGWPEVVEPSLKVLTGFDPAELEVGKPWDVSGFGLVAVAWQEAGKPNPSKVVAISKASGA